MPNIRKGSSVTETLKNKSGPNMDALTSFAFLELHIGQPKAGNETATKNINGKIFFTCKKSTLYNGAILW